MIIEKMDKSHVEAVTHLALKLWPENNWEHLYPEFEDMLTAERDCVYLANDAGNVVGFIHLSLRVDYVECSSTSPVGYIEALYVKESYRLKGISRQLVEQGEAWAKARGCSEMASDTWLDNLESQAFHEKIGFKEAGRTVSFIKNI